MTCLRIGLLLALLPRIVCAQEPAAPAVDPNATCALQSLYDSAFELYANGDYHGAVSALEQVTQSCPQLRGAADLLSHARARESAITPRLLGSPQLEPPSSSSVVVESAVQGEPRSDLARIELVIMESLFGIFHGTWLCAWSNTTGCDATGVAGSALLGASLFGGVTAALTYAGISDGQGTAIESATFFGNYLGFAVWMASGMPGTNGIDDSRGVALAPLLVGEGVGTFTGIMLAALASPKSGHVALASSGGLWGGMTAMFASLAVSMSNRNPTYDPWAYGVSQLIGVPLGIGVGLIAGLFYPTSRGRMLLVDGGTILAGGVGAALAALTNANGNNYMQHLGIWEAAMVPIGFATMMALTHILDVPADAMNNVRVMPAAGNGPGVTVAVQF